jgi:hypothetical protein
MESPASYDPRRTDTAFVEKLLDTVVETGKMAELPVMNTAELYAAGALSHPLLDDHALAWWNAQPDQETTARQGYEHMAGRKMIDPDTGRIHPLLAIILAARSRPAFIIIVRAQPDGAPLPVRFLGVADETAGLRAVLAENAPPTVVKENQDVGPLYSYELSGPRRTSRHIAAFTTEARHPAIDFYLPGSVSGLPAQRFLVTRALRGLRVERHTAGGAPQQVTCSQEELADMLLDTMTGACR